MGRHRSERQEQQQQQHSLAGTRKDDDRSLRFRQKLLHFSISFRIFALLVCSCFKQQCRLLSKKMEQGSGAVDRHRQCLSMDGSRSSTAVEEEILMILVCQGVSFHGSSISGQSVATFCFDSSSSKVEVENEREHLTNETSEIFFYSMIGTTGTHVDLDMYAYIDLRLR